MDILYQDDCVLVAVKPSGVLSTDVSGGMPDLVRTALGDSNADIRTVHRLDAVVSGLMLLAMGGGNASLLSAQIRDGIFKKRYLAVAHGVMPSSGEYRDLLLRDRNEGKTYITDTPGKNVQEAVLLYETLKTNDEMSLVEIELITGRTHHIRCQFSGHGHPLYFDRKYCLPRYPDDNPESLPIALWSSELSFIHPKSGVRMSFSAPPPDIFPWNTI